MVTVEDVLQRHGGNNECRALKASSPTLNCILDRIIVYAIIAQRYARRFS